MAKTKSTRSTRRVKPHTYSLVHLQIGFTAVGVAIAAGMVATGEDRSVALIAFLSLSLMLPALTTLILAPIFGAVLIHEFGHLVGGRCAGFRFVSVRVGPIRWTDHGRSIDWNVQPPLGLCEMEPNYGLPTRREALVFVAGGPLASLLGTVLSMLVFWGAGGVFDFAYPFVGKGFPELIQLAAWLGVIGNGSALLICLLPVSTAGLASDGLHLLDLWRRRAR